MSPSEGCEEDENLQGDKSTCRQLHLSFSLWGSYGTELVFGSCFHLRQGNEMLHPCFSHPRPSVTVWMGHNLGWNSCCSWGQFPVRNREAVISSSWGRVHQLQENIWVSDHIIYCWRIAWNWGTSSRKKNQNGSKKYMLWSIISRFLYHLKDDWTFNVLRITWPILLHWIFIQTTKTISCLSQVLYVLNYNAVPQLIIII